MSELELIEGIRAVSDEVLEEFESVAVPPVDVVGKDRVYVADTARGAYQGALYDTAVVVKKYD
ncbi:hypothetical protein KY362_00630 [Candidatus Woesearchaeota archaeon]|nr:hypothetical protein [Candidatus Woesearchaeota archaeon]